MLLVLFPDVGTRSKGSSIDQDKFQGSYEYQRVIVSRLFIIAAKDRSSKSSNSKDVSSYKCSHCVDVSGDVENVPMFGRDRSECLNAAFVHWRDQNRSQGSQYGQEESGNNEVVPDRSCNLPHIQVCCCFLTNGPDRSLSQHFRSHEDTNNAASQTVNLKNSSKDAKNESTVVDKQNEAKDITVKKADKSSSSTRGQSKMDGKCSSSTEDPNLDGQSSRDYEELKRTKVPSGTRSPIITNDLIVAKGEDIADSNVPVLNGVKYDNSVGAATELPSVPARLHEVYFRRSPPEVRPKSPCAAIPDQS